MLGLLQTAWKPTTHLLGHSITSSLSLSPFRGHSLSPGARPFFNARKMASQRLPTRLTGPPRFIGLPCRTPTPRAPTPGVTTARATGRGRSTTPGLTMHPTGYATYWQYTTALACSVLTATNPAISSADNAIESFILASSIRNV